MSNEDYIKAQRAHEEAVAGSHRPTAAEVKAGILLVFAVTEAIRELGEAPAGPIYAALMHKTGMDFQTFEKVVSIITGSGLVVKRGDLLVWIGPRLSEVVS